MKPTNDLHTSTVEGAAEFENQRAKYEQEELDLTDEDRIEDDDYDDNERCGCSDPGCPCVGNKKGSL